MKWRSAFALLAFTLAFQTRPSRAQDAKTDIETLERAWMSAIATGDKGAYDRLLAEDFTWTYVSGRAIGRSQMIETMGPVTVKERDKAIRVYNGSAVVTGIASLDVGGRPLTERFVRVWVRISGGKWQLAHFQATEIN